MAFFVVRCSCQDVNHAPHSGSIGPSDNHLGCCRLGSLKGRSSMQKVGQQTDIEGIRFLSSTARTRVTGRFGTTPPKRPQNCECIWSSPGFVPAGKFSNPGAVRDALRNCSQKELHPHPAVLHVPEVRKKKNLSRALPPCLPDKNKLPVKLEAF